MLGARSSGRAGGHVCWLGLRSDDGNGGAEVAHGEMRLSVFCLGLGLGGLFFASSKTKVPPICCIIFIVLCKPKPKILAFLNTFACH